MKCNFPINHIFAIHSFAFSFQRTKILLKQRYCLRGIANRVKYANVWNNITHDRACPTHTSLSFECHESNFEYVFFCRTSQFDIYHVHYFAAIYVCLCRAISFSHIKINCYLFSDLNIEVMVKYNVLKVLSHEKA